MAKKPVVGWIDICRYIFWHDTGAGTREFEIEVINLGISKSALLQTGSY